MNDEPNNLLDGYLDDTLSPEERRRFQTRIRHDPNFARQTAVGALLHDRLRTEFGLAQPAGRPETAERKARTGGPFSRSPRRTWIAATLFTTAALVVIGFFLFHADTAAPASAANIAIDRLLEAARRQVDRVYRIRITDYGPGGPRPQVRADRGGVKPNVDGAELSVRGSDQFVLLRRFADDTPFVTGSDGEIGWAVPPSGRVHLSRDVRRYRRAVPGEHAEIPFLDLPAGLETLRRDYDLRLVEGDPSATGPESWSRLEGQKRPHVRGGAQRVRIQFDAAGTAHHISLAGLSPGEPDGSPESVELELLADRPVPPDFFRHESHHAADRPLGWE